MTFKPITISLIVILFFCNSQTSCAQIGHDNSPYLITKTIPEFKISRSPDSTIFTNANLKKNTNTVFIMFSPDCEFCQHETRDLLKNISKFKNTQFIMVSFKPQKMINDFYIKYGIAKHPGITIGKDSKYFFFKFFKLKIAPSTFVYDKKGNLKQAFNQIVDMNTLLKETNN